MKIRTTSLLPTLTVLAALQSVILAGPAQAQSDGLKGTTPLVTHALPSPNVSYREPRVLVLHYTAVSQAEVFDMFTSGHVSAHYTVDKDGSLYQHVDERLAAHHAGLSFWRFAKVNQTSIGIEIVNRGYLPTADDAPTDAATSVDIGELSWEVFTPSQIRTVIALSADIMRRYAIDPFDVVGHADVAPQRKQDPGPAFPWLELARAGVGVAYDRALGALVCGEKTFELSLTPEQLVEDVAWTQVRLAEWGYAVPQTGVLDEATQQVVLAFGAHYLGRYDAHVTQEMQTVLAALLAWRRQHVGEAHASS